jgi:hypothetical protein
MECLYTVIRIYISTTTMESNMEAPQSSPLKKSTTILSSNTTPGHISEGNVSQDIIKTLAHPCLLQHYSIAKPWKQSRCPTTD